MAGQNGRLPPAELCHDERMSPISEQSATAASVAAVAATGRGNGYALAALLCSVAAFVLAGPIAVVAWPLMAASITCIVLAKRNGATHRWMTTLAIVLLAVGALVSLVMPLLTVLVAILMLGEASFDGVPSVFWYYWSGEYLFAG